MGLILWLWACSGDPTVEPEGSWNPDDVEQPDAEPPVVGCQVGTTEVCDCPDASTGTRTCVGADDLWSSCGCDLPDVDGEDLYVPPPEPEEMVCMDGAVTCPEYRGDDVTEAGAHHCCVRGDTCGSNSDFIFGDQCIVRGGDPGVPSEECPNEYPNFLDLYGCCRSDGLCGLSIDHVSNWDIGCIERTEMERLVNEGSEQRDLLSLVFFLPVEDADFRRMRCGP